jgi:hypothetical protein
MNQDLGRSELGANGVDRRVELRLVSYITRIPLGIGEVSRQASSQPSHLPALVEVLYLSGSLATSASLTGGKHYAEARLTAHHARIRFCGTFQGNGFDHCTNVLEHAECQRVLDVDGGAGQAAFK